MDTRGHDRVPTHAQMLGARVKDEIVQAQQTSESQEQKMEAGKLLAQRSENWGRRISLLARFSLGSQAFVGL